MDGRTSGIKIDYEKLWASVLTEAAAVMLETNMPTVHLGLSEAVTRREASFMIGYNILYSSLDEPDWVIRMN